MKIQINKLLTGLLLTAVTAACFVGPAWAGKFYKCFNEDGELVYQQVACDSDVKQETVHVFTAPDQRSRPGSPLMGDSEYIAEGVEPATADPLRFQASLSNVIAQLSPIKVAVQQYYVMNGAWPAQPGDMGFNQDNLKSSDINEVMMGDQGAIMVWLSERFGQEKRLVMAPRMVMDGTSMEWQCMANFPTSALSIGGVPLCQSRASR
ncbi:MAG: pilin [Candidatus Thiodiazotropha sp.]